jgi:hypothetical protein
MKNKEEFITEEKAEFTPAGGAFIGKKDGQTIIHDEGTMSGYLVGKLHKDGGIKAVNKATGQPLEMQGGEIVITAPAVSDTTKREFEGKMMTNREILSKINSDGGGVSFADGGDIPAKIHTTDKQYEYGGKMVQDSDIAHSLGMNSTLKKGKQQFSSGGKTYDVDAIYNAIKKGKLRLKTKEVETFAMKYPIYDKEYSETVKTDFRKPNGIMVRLENGEEVLIDGNHRMNNAYLKGKKTIKTYYIEDPKQIAKFTKNNKFELGGNITIKKDPIELVGSKVKIHYKGGIYGDKNVDKKYLKTLKGANSERKQFGKITGVKRIGNSNKPNVYDDYLFEVTFDDNQKDDYKIKEIDFYDQNNNYLNPSFSSVKLYAEGGHLSKNKSLKQIAEMHNVSLAHINEQLAKGLEVEKEHFADFKERTRVAKDHLVENPNYYSILAKAGLKMGGHIQKQDLVENSKKGDTPARDLNNYNDLLDVQADSIVGADNGLIFANGGKLGNEPKEGDLITNFGKYGKSIFDVDDNYVYWLDQYASKQYCKKSDLSLNNLDDDGDDDGYYEDERNNWICNKTYAKGGVTPYDANLEGDSVSVLSTGGGVGLPKVAYVKISNTGASLVKLMGLKYNSYIEFAESVQEAYKPFVNIKPIRRSFVEIQAYDENDNKLVNANTYIADQKNTVKNFNPTTGNYKNLEKSLANSRPRIFQKFDWEDWFLSKVKPSTTNSQTPTSTSAQPFDLTNTKIVLDDPEMSEKVQKRAFELGWSWNGSKEVKKRGERFMFFNKEKNISFGVNFSGFQSNQFKEIFEHDLFGSQTPTYSYLPLDLSDTKVWIGDDERLSKAIQEVAFELGWSWSGGKTVQNTDAKYLVFNSMKFIGYRKDGREAFDANISKEINPQDILLAKKAVITTSSSTSSSNKPFDFTDTKINVKGDLDLSVKVQKKAFESGWEWENGIGKAIDYSTINYLYFTKKSMSDGFTASSFVNSPKREITEVEIFGSQTPNITSSTTSAQSSSKKDVQSVLVTYAGGQQYVALNEQRLLDKIVELWKTGGRSTMGIILQPQGFVTTLSSPLNILLDTIRASKNSVQPSTLSISELKGYLSIEWYPELNWSDFFKEAQTTTSSSAQPFDLSQTKIWIGNDEEVSKQIQERAFELGWSFKGLTMPKSTKFTNRPALYFNADKDIYYGDYDRQIFDSDNTYREITVDELFGTPNTTSKPVVPKTVDDKKFTDFKEAVSALEGFASQASKKYNTADYEDSLQLFKEVKEEYSLALSFTPESSFMYERIELMKKINEVQKEITRITELKNGGAYYILAKVIDRLEKSENWKESGIGEIMINEVPEQEIESVIYTDKFKNWFGNWEEALITKEYDYVSKALTANGKPVVMFHGAKRIKYSYRQVSNGVVYLAENRSYAEWFSATDSPYQKQGDYLTQCFVNIKNPIDLTVFGVEEVDLRDIIQFIDTVYPLAKIYDVLPPNTAMAIMNNQLIGRNFRAWYIIRQFPELNKHIRDNTDYDGFIYYENNPSDMIISEITGEMEENITKATAVFNSNQVKLVDAMLFDSSLDDWRFEQGGKVN